MTRTAARTGLLLALAVTGVALALAQPPKTLPPPAQLPPPPGSTERTADVQVKGHIVKPAELPPPEPTALKLPAGFKIEVFASDLGNSRILAVSPAGNVYVTRREQADILMLKPGKGGAADGKPTRVFARPGTHGLCFHDGKAYVATVKEVFRAEVKEDGTFGEADMIIHDLPDGGQHPNRTLAVGPDKMLYISVGSTCNECLEPNPENATIVRATLDGKMRAIYAAGLRNTIGFDWHPTTGDLWGMDHGTDWLGDDEQPEELNRLDKDRHYGWPFVFGGGTLNPRQDPPAGLEKSEWAKVGVPMAAGYTAHSAPMQLAFYTAAQFPAAFQGDAFVTMRGSWNRKPPSGYEVVRVRFKDGKPAGFEPFVTGFLTDKGQSARPCGLAAAKDGSLLFTDDRNGVIYRVSYAGTDKPGVEVKRSEGKPPQPLEGPLAIKAVEAKGGGKLTVTSPAYKDGEKIPVKYSGYDQNASVPLAWTKGPDGTRSYVVLMDDPDAKALELPVPHWVAWNVPADTTELREGLHKEYRLTDPKKMDQGRNYLRRPGYDGPKPPPGDPPHHYHTQVFALDTTLDLPVGALRQDVLAAMKGHVLAAGELVGTFERPKEPKRPE
jgi:Raf kinase inhibitor-like YbhB/YbcL family protein